MNEMRKLMETAKALYESKSAAGSTLRIVNTVVEPGDEEDWTETTHTVKGTAKLDGTSMYYDYDTASDYDVKVRKILIISNENNDKSIWIKHNASDSIYSDSGFEASISKLLGYKVTFTEKDMQMWGEASMEAYPRHEKSSTLEAYPRREKTKLLYESVFTMIDDNGIEREVNVSVEGVDTSDYPDFCDAYLVGVWADTGEDLSRSEEDRLRDEYDGLASELAHDSLF